MFQEYFLDSCDLLWKKVDVFSNIFYLHHFDGGKFVKTLYKMEQGVRTLEKVLRFDGFFGKYWKILP